MLLTAGTVIGVGLGGFADGIVFHQLAQWHHVGSNVLPPLTLAAMSRNVFWDGLLHLGSWVTTAIGVSMLYKDARAGFTIETPSVFVGQMMFGWGLFNLVEGVVNHHLLKLHHVHDIPVHKPAFDWAFLAIGGLVPLALGRMLTAPARAMVAGAVAGAVGKPADWYVVK